VLNVCVLPCRRKWAGVVIERSTFLFADVKHVATVLCLPLALECKISRDILHRSGWCSGGAYLSSTMLKTARVFLGRLVKFEQQLREGCLSSYSNYDNCFFWLGNSRSRLDSVLIIAFNLSGEVGGKELSENLIFVRKAFSS
jgi:hypothetical protein